jgi:hypothetical protein
MNHSPAQIQQFKSEIRWLESCIWELEVELYKKPGLQKQIDNLKHQVKHHEYTILLNKEI